MLLRSGKLTITIPKNNFVEELLLSNLKKSENENDLLKVFSDINEEIYKKGVLLGFTKETLLSAAKSKRNEMKQTKNLFWSKKVAQEFGIILKKMKTLERLSKFFQKSSKNKNIIGYLKNLHNTQNQDSFMPNIFDGYCCKRLFTKISCGGNFLVALTQDGEVFTAGSNNFGQLGHSNNSNISTLTQVKNIPNIKYISAGYAYTCVISKKGSIYSWGAGQDGRLGNNSEEDVNYPVKLETNWIATSIQCGSTHTVALSKDNKIYSWGYYCYNGHNATENTLIPTIIDSIQHIMFYQISIGVGGYHTMALSYVGNVYVWGHNRVGQLGINRNHCEKNKDEAYYLAKPQICDSLINIPIVNISAGWGHSGVLSANNKIYMCGRNNKGQIGIDPESCPVNERGHPFTFNFTLLNNYGYPKKIQKVICGGEHTMALLEGGNIIGWGDNQFLQLGNKEIDDFTYKPIFLEKNELSYYFDLASTPNYSFVLDCNINKLPFN